MKSSRSWLILLIALIACNLPLVPGPSATSVAVEDAPSVDGVWQGSLQDLTKNAAGQMTLTVQTNEKGFDGTVEFHFDGLASETYPITGTLTGAEFQFGEPSGRSFWGTFDGDGLQGFIAWDCFHCEHWGEFSLTRRTDLAPAEASTTVPSSPGLIRFEDLADGDPISASVDPLTGLPTATVTITSDDSSKMVFLDADGISVGYADLQGRSTVEVQWTPWHGNGPYTLDVYLMQSTAMAGDIVSQQSIQVNVTGIPEGTATVAERFSQLFQERFGFYPTQPAIARYIRLFPDALDPSQWVSAVYYGDYSYELRIFDDGQISQYYTYVNFDDEYSICRPSGSIRMLAVIVDYGNTGTDPNLVIDDLYESLSVANRRWADYSAGIGLSQPILQVDLTTAIAGAPATPGQYLTPEEVLSRTGHDPAQFDLLTEIDLDRDNLATGQYGGLGVSLSGGCRPSGANRVNIGMVINDSAYYKVGGSVFEHELIHALGWQHWWANGNGSTPDWSRLQGYWMPARMFGWTDLDGDGVIEIQDPTPYGIQ